MATNINDIMAQAQQAALAHSAASLPASIPNVGTPAIDLSLDDVLSDNLVVDKWLKVDKPGLFIRGSNVYFDEIDVTIDMTQIVPYLAVRYGNPAVYKKTRNGVTVEGGGDWPAIVEQAKRASGWKEGDMSPIYKTVNIPMTSLMEITDRKGEVLVQVGNVLGHGTSPTSWKHFTAFAQAVKKNGWSREVVKVKVSFLLETSKKMGANYAAMKFELLGLANQMAEAA